MEINFKIDEGHFFDKDEIIALAHWKVPELIMENMTNKEIIEFYDDKEWQRQAQLLLNKLN